MWANDASTSNGTKASWQKYVILFIQINLITFVIIPFDHLKLFHFIFCYRLEMETKKVQFYIYDGRLIS